MMKVGAGFGVMMMSKDKVLLGRRHDDKDKADSDLRGEGTWTFPGGKLEFGETLEEGAAREVLEETGITLNSVKIIAINNDKNEHAHYVTAGMYSEDFSGEPSVMEPDEIIKWAWFSLDKLPENLFMPTRKLIKNYLENKFYIKEE